MADITQNNDESDQTPISCQQESNCLFHFSCRKPKTEQADDTKIFSDACLIIIFGWFGAKSSSVEKYRNLYHERGIDVLFIEGKLPQFVWPPNSVVLAKEINEYLETKCSRYKYYIVHAFSIGAYNFTNCLQLASRYPGQYDNITIKTIGIIYDSLTIGSVKQMVNGMTTGSSSNKLKQIIFRHLLNTFLFVTKKCIMDRHEKSVEFFKESPLHVPTLFFACLNDPMSDPDALNAMLTSWQKMTFDVTSKIWSKSAHASHLSHHHKEYVKKLDDFLDFVGIYAEKKQKNVNILKSKL
ncbi:uncharacterized protein LOC126817118 [Patella vulgata]|uniref:uncharacterized protein LOC126817118 n=1 Tax=Patella vulgata TaxID=6465 RepID=UPI0021804615|nr:uncharacterized protein LOC126817118 [Patella vulgata]